MTNRIRLGHLVPALILSAALLVPWANTRPAAAAPTATAYPTDRVADPHQAGVTYFASTGHTLRGTFATYWQKYGGLAQFGYPITEEFQEDGVGDGPAHMVQYFERNRFEAHPENAGTPFEVLLGRLGANFHAPDPAVAAQANPATHYFRETGHNVGPLFYNYWNTHGGVFVHGFPISEAVQETNPIDGKTYTVQYFERSRFEAHPENAGTAYEVQLGLLGTQQARKLGYFAPGAGSSAYPKQGHAADYSWIAGKVQVTRIQGGCVFVAYDGDQHLQPIGSGWDAAQTDATLSGDGADVVLFGHWATASDPHPMCPARDYVVDKVMANP